MSDNYIARCKCKNVVCIISGDSEKKEIAKTVSGWIRDGLEIERMQTEDFRKLKYMKPSGFGCICNQQTELAPTAATD